MHKIACSLLCILATSALSQPFVHPGMLHTRGDLDRMRQMVQQKRDPWMAAWSKLQAASVSKLTYSPHAVENLTVAAGGAEGTGQQDDASAAHFHAIQWYVTQNEAHARKAIEILNAWSYKFKTMGGHNARLQTGIAGYHFCNAAEILLHTYGGWSATDVAQFKKMITGVFYPTIQNWAPSYNGNWDAYMILTMMSIAIFTDDRAMFDKAVAWYNGDKSHGSLTGYIYASGQCQESTRDQMHVQMGLGAMAGACETGFHQGLDMYGAVNNHFLLGLEYTAKYNLGESVPSQGTMGSGGRGQLRPMWEISYNHYVVRKKMSAPYLTRVVQKVRPEGFEQDYISLGTFFFHSDPGITISIVPKEALPSLRATKRGSTMALWYDASGRRILGLQTDLSVVPFQAIQRSIPQNQSYDKLSIE